MKWRYDLLGLLFLTVACGSTEEKNEQDEPFARRWAELTVQNVNATVSLQSDWGSGYCADVFIKNGGSVAVSGWEVTLQLRASSITSLWNGQLAQDVVTPAAHNARIDPGQTASFGFCANATGKDYLPSVAGLTFDGGGGSAAGGSPGSGGSASGGRASGGASSGGASSGGASSGGASSASGGRASGGASSGGTPSGGASTGGRSSGGAPSGSSSGGSSSATSSATLHIDNDWGSGYCATIDPASNKNWTVQIDLHNSVINNLWNGTFSTSGSRATVSGTSDTFGFCARTLSSGNYLPTLISADGQSSSGGSSSGGRSSGGASSGGASSGGASSGGASAGGGSENPDPIVQGCNGYATRFWDCCKPHCGWPGNVPGGVSPMTSCNSQDQPLMSYDTQSACGGGDAHTCYGLAPYAVNDKLAYGYAATSSGDVCGRCYQLQFTGSSHNAGGDPGSAALSGKTMIVQTINIGFDVSGGQFDLLIPGGGVGQFNACSAQWGVSNAELGAQYGGLLSACKSELGYNAGLSAYKSCVRSKCDSVFGSRGLTDLAAGCRWFADWFEAADNPALKYKEVACPAQLSGDSGMNRSGRSDISTACGN